MEEEMNLVGEDFFDFLPLPDKTMFQTAFRAVSELRLWSFLQEPMDSFLYSEDPRVILILRKIISLGYDGHSGTSFSLVMRELQKMSKIGHVAWRAETRKAYDAARSSRNVGA